jgi:hypothetical protein
MATSAETLEQSRRVLESIQRLDELQQAKRGSADGTAVV